MAQPYALVVDSTIVNICLWDGETPFSPPAEVIDLSTLPPGVGIGWSNATGEWLPPASG